MDLPAPVLLCLHIVMPAVACTSHQGLADFHGAALGCQPCCRDVTLKRPLVQDERNQKAAQKKGFDTKSLHKTQNLLMVRTHLIISRIAAELCTVTLGALLTMQLTQWSQVLQHSTCDVLMILCTRQAFVKTAPPKPTVEEPVVRQPEPAAVAATGCIDAAMDAAKHTASASDLEAGSREILESWAAQRGHHKHVFGQ